jgi:regulator of replication initiation timing
MKTLADLKQISLEVLIENSNLKLENENDRILLAEKIEERYKNVVTIIAKDYLQKEIDSRSTLSTFDKLINRKVN